MVKSLRIILFVALIIVPIALYKSLSQRNDQSSNTISFIGGKRNEPSRAQIALIFDDLGESLQDLKDLYALKIPLTISVIPNLKFSKNIAHIGSRCGFSVFIHLPLEPKAGNRYRTDKYRFITTDMSKREIESLLRFYLNSIRIAIGVNNHMGSKATEDSKLMATVVREMKKRNLSFVDSRTSLNSVAYKIADREGLVCGYNEGFLDATDDRLEIEKSLSELIKKATEKGKIIVIAHPRKNTINFLKNNLSALRKKVEFITIKDYFDL